MSSAKPAVGILVDLSSEKSASIKMTVPSFGPSQSTISTPSATTITNLREIVCESAESKIKRLERAHLWEKISAQRWKIQCEDLRRQLAARPTDRSEPLEGDAKLNPPSTGVFEDLAQLIDISEPPPPTPASPPVIKPSPPSLFSRAITDITSQRKQVDVAAIKKETALDLQITKLSIKTREQHLLIEQLKAELAAAQTECRNMGESLNRSKTREDSEIQQSGTERIPMDGAAEGSRQKTESQVTPSVPVERPPPRIPRTDPGGYASSRQEGLKHLRNDMNALRNNLQAVTSRVHTLEMRVTQHHVVLSTPPPQPYPWQLDINDLNTSWANQDNTIWQPIYPPPSHGVGWR